MKVLFVNSKEKSCGVYQYGDRLRCSFLLSKHDIQYCEVENFYELTQLDFTNVVLIIVNYIGCDGSGPFGWYNTDVVSYIKNTLQLKTATIRHTMDYRRATFDYYICQNPTDDIFSIPRPLHPAKIYSTNNDCINVGSFGFAGAHKGFDTVVNLVNHQFDSAKINLHITSAHYGDVSGKNRRYIIDRIREIPLKPNIELNISDNFLDSETVSEFALNNDILLFPYSSLPGEGSDNCAVSSIVDYAVSWKIPFGITNVFMFRHLYNESVDVYKNSILDILQYHKQSHYVETLHSRWSNIEMAQKLDKIIQTTTQSL